MDFEKTTKKELTTALTSSASNFYYLRKGTNSTVNTLKFLDVCDLKRYFVAARGHAVKRSTFLEWEEGRLDLLKTKVYQYKNLFLVEYEYAFCIYELNFGEHCQKLI